MLLVNDLLHKDEIQDLNDLPIEAEEEELLGETSSNSVNNAVLICHLK